jgi:hypothetical protein
METDMLSDIKSGQQVRLTIQKPINREGARKTLVRLFMQDKAVSKPIARRQKGLTDLPKRRGGRIWTKYANKIQLELERGMSATIKATPQSIKDLNSVKSFIEIASA